MPYGEIAAPAKSLEEQLGASVDAITAGKPKAANGS